jgi:hypothetical protein
MTKRIDLVSNLTLEFPRKILANTFYFPKLHSHIHNLLIHFTYALRSSYILFLSIQIVFHAKHKDETYTLIIILCELENFKPTNLVY